MDFIKRILLILILVLATFSFDEANSANLYDASKCATISTLKSFEKDLIGVKDNEFSLSAIQNSNTQLNSRRNNDNQNGTSENSTISVSKQFENIITYIHNHVDLDDKSELALLLLLHQIQPNAP